MSNRIPSLPADLDQLAILLDVDGTLLDLAPTPREVFVSHALRAALARLWERTGGAVAFVSGRPVSELDFTNPVTISGSNIPSLTKREARTTIELRDGQSFAIAGLLQARNRRGISQLPWIGSVPVLGALFRSSAYQQEETDLVVIVTPHLVAPSVPGQRLASPLDNYLPSNDVDFFLMGDMEQKKKFRDYITSGGDIQGPYGHMIRSGSALPAISAPPISAKN